MINNLKVAYLLINRTALGVHPLTVIVMIFSNLVKYSKIGVTPPLPTPKYVNIIRKDNLCKHYQNVDIALRMYVCSAISYFSAEILISVLKREKLYNSYLFNIAFIRLQRAKLNLLAICL